jgi:hypothetical protein
MRPHTAFDDERNSRAHDRRARKRPREVTLRSFFRVALARLQTLFAARHASDSSLDDVLGEQVRLPDAYPRPASHASRAPDVQAQPTKFSAKRDPGKLP